MMKFEEIIREAGLSVQDYPTASQIPVTLYDRKDRVITSPISFYEPLFSKNPAGKAAFAEAVKVLDEAPFKTEFVSARIDEYHVILHYRTPHVRIFSRNTRLTPLDYMD